MDVRRVRAVEWHALKDLRVRALVDTPRAFGTTAAQARARSDDEWRELASRGEAGVRWITYVADDGGKLVGMASGTFPEQLHRDVGQTEAPWLIQMWVAAEARRRGVGRRLVEAVAAWAAERDARTLRLEVALAEPGAVAFYRSLGFTETGERQLVSTERDDEAIVMERACRT